jgi:uncharacterized cupin superfamily protein
MTKPVLNIDEVVVQAVALQGDVATRYDLRKGEIARHIGARKLGYRLTVVAPDKRACPFHSHRNDEEMFFILEGTGELRHGDARYPLRAGDVVACPPGGPETAHQIINTGTVELRYLAVSTMEPVEICEYPDSGKFGAFVDGEPRAFRHIGMPGDAHDYWEGE